MNLFFRSGKITGTYSLRYLIILTVSIIAISGLVNACNMPSGSNSSLDSTKAALDAQATELAQQADQEAQDLQATIVSQQSTATHLAQQEAQPTIVPPTTVPQPTAVPPTTAPQPTAVPPTTAPQPTDTPQIIVVTPTFLTPTSEAPQTQVPDFDEMMKSAKILLFEDMAGLYEVRYIKNALDGMNLSTNYVDVGDASGNFKSQLLSGTDWDLIIAASESRNKVQGEFFVYINDHINKGVGVIIEMWALDQIASGTINTITTRCGIKFQKDWWQPEFLSVWWLAPEHPVFHEPNEGVSLARFTNRWPLDAGDLIEKLPGSEAILLAGTIATEKQRYGTLAICLEGRLIFQTYSTHNHRQEDVVRLWQNYIYNVLKAHFTTVP